MTEDTKDAMIMISNQIAAKEIEQGEETTEIIWLEIIIQGKQMSVPPPPPPRKAHEEAHNV